MDKEVIFDLDIERIESEKLRDIIIKTGSIKMEHYTKLAEVLKRSPHIERASAHIEHGTDEYWNNFFKVFMPKEGEFSIDPSKLILSGDVDKFNCDFFKYVENFEMRPERISEIKQIKEKLPNLKNIELADIEVTSNDIGENLSNLLDTAKLTKAIKLKSNLGIESVRTFIERSGESEHLVLSDDGKCLINADKIMEKSEKPISVTLNLSDLEKIGLDKITQSGDNVTLVINNTNDLSNTKLQELKNAGLNIEGIQIFTKENNFSQNEVYDVQTYTAIRDKLEEVVEGIDINAPDKEKFAEVYKRICKNIIYDTPAAYPVTMAQEKYSEEQNSNCRNLKNGLLEGKCVCAGYADILRNALSMVGIEAKYITGMSKDKTVNEDKFNEKKYSQKYVIKNKDGKIDIGECHAWNKVKLDGVWYNVDATWDANKMRLGQVPTHCLKSDKQIEKDDDKCHFKGPECNTVIEDKDIEEMFGGKHIFIGKTRIPNANDILAGIRSFGESYKELGIDIKNHVIKFKEKIFKESEKPLKLNAPQSEKSTSKLNSWDLSNWGIDKEQFREDTDEIVKSNTTSSKETNTNKTLDNQR